MVGFQYVQIDRKALDMLLMSTWNSWVAALVSVLAVSFSMPGLDNVEA